MIKIEKRNKIDIITFTINRINALVTDEIHSEILRVIDNNNSKLIIDLKGVEYIDSSGFGCFLSIMKASRSTYGVLKFSNPEPRVMDLFKTLHLHSVFQIFEDTEECLRSFN